MAQPVSFVDPTLLAKISDLELLARTVVEGVMSGIHRSPHSGSSIEFAQYRPYVQGDDLRFVDWKLYGRTDRLHLKQFQEETNLRCTILLDCSGSMGYSSGGVDKFLYARMLAASLAMMLQKQKDAAGFIGYHHELVKHLPPRTSRNHMRQILVELDGLRAEGKTNTAATLRFLGDIIQPRGMVVLISDLLHPLGEMLKHLKSLRAMRHDVIVIQITDPAEKSFPFDFSQTFIDAEDSTERFAIPQIVRREYLDNRREHFDAIRRECLSAEIGIEEMVTDEPLDRALHFFINRRNRSLMSTSRKRSRSGGFR